MNNLEATFFSPMGRQYCDYFYFLTVFAFIFFLFAIYDVITSLFIGKTNIFRALLTLIFPFLIYFNNRLLYSMCVN